MYICPRILPKVLDPASPHFTGMATQCVTGMVWWLLSVSLGWCGGYSVCYWDGVVATQCVTGMVWCVLSVSLGWCGGYLECHWDGVVATQCVTGMVW